jgi:hypothetical protein
MLMFISSVVEFDNLKQASVGLGDFDHGLMIDMAVAALAAPEGENTSK